jgi:hypothetical protein
VLDPDGLLAVARLLLDETTAPVTDAGIRRAVSTAYYALFHTILRAAADRFAGTGHETSAAFGLIYRSFDHRQMADVCKRLRASTLSDAMKRPLRRDAVSQDIRDFASAFAAMQDACHLADYDPAAVFEPSDAGNLIEAAENAIAAFGRAESAEQADILALLMVKPRT